MFKVGDRVVCVDASRVAVPINLELGKIYTIKEFCDLDESLVTLEEMGIDVYSASRFQLINSIDFVTKD